VLPKSHQSLFKALNAEILTIKVTTFDQDLASLSTYGSIVKSKDFFFALPFDFWLYLMLANDTIVLSIKGAGI
jgi:hypothetical protein